MVYEKISIWMFFFVVGKKKVNWIGIAVLIGNWVGNQFF
jgi:hypothetical protein